MIDGFFQLRENRTDARTEILAGATTFVTLAYILFGNPNILKDAGMPLEATFAATCVASAFSTLVMGLYANYPIAVVPGMGLNAYFTHRWSSACGYRGRSRSARCSSPAPSSSCSRSRLRANGSSGACRRSCAPRFGLIPILFSFTFVDLFDNIGTLIGVSSSGSPAAGTRTM